jgi:hypothetical protein
VKVLRAFLSELRRRRVYRVAVEVRDLDVQSVTADPILADLRSEPSIQRVLERVRLLGTAEPGT